MPKHKTKGPISLYGAPLTLKLAPGGALRLRVVATPAAWPLGRPAELRLLAPADGGDGGGDGGGGGDEGGGTIELQLAPRSDCVLLARRAPGSPPPGPLPPGCAGEIAVDAVGRHNLRLLPGEAYDFLPFCPDPSEGVVEERPAGAEAGAASEAAVEASEAGLEASEAGSFDLVDLELEVRLADAAVFGGGGGGDSGGGSGDASEAEQHGGEGGRGAPGEEAGEEEQMEVDAAALAAAFGCAYFGRVVAVNEYIVLPLAGRPLLLRALAANTLTPEEQEEACGYHCFRGRVAPETRVFLVEAPEAEEEAGAGGTAAATAAGAGEQAAAGASEAAAGAGAGGARPAGRGAQTRVSRGGRVRLLGAARREERPPPTNVVHVYTSDGEWFPVKKKLLRPCIALTAAVRDSGAAAARADVAVGTLTFDRVLIFLEALALGREPPEFALHLIDDLRAAAEVLGLRPLEEYCRRRLGQRLAALGTYTAADIRRATAEGKVRRVTQGTPRAVWLVMQGMVLDVGRWLPEHPGGATIIPRQALDCDSSRLFELYHASRESFLYLREFYIGELLPGEELPQGGGNPAPPSADFLAQLAEYTRGFRMDPSLLPQGGRAFKSF